MKITGFLLLMLTLSSCSTVHTNQLSYTQAERLKLQDQANAGDAEAQFQVGNSWCCSDQKGFFDTEEALAWWCKAAAQGHKAAQAQLTKYSVDNKECDI